MISRVSGADAPGVVVGLSMGRKIIEIPQANNGFRATAGLMNQARSQKMSLELSLLSCVLLPVGPPGMIALRACHRRPRCIKLSPVGPTQGSSWDIGRPPGLVGGHNHISDAGPTPDLRSHNPERYSMKIYDNPLDSNTCAELYGIPPVEAHTHT